jgi:hypothetical protein
LLSLKEKSEVNKLPVVLRSSLGLKKRIRLGESYQLPLSFTFTVSPMRSAAVGFPRRALFPQPGFKGDKRWLPLAFAVIASDSDTRDLEHPGGNAGLIAGPEVADALDHLHKHFGGQVFRCGTIRYAGSNRAKDSGKELAIERAQRLGFPASRTIKLAFESLHWVLTSVGREGLPSIVALWFIVGTGARKNTAHGPFVC